MAYWLVAHALGCERAHLALGAQQLLRWRARGEPREQCKVAAHFLLHAAEKAIDETAWASSLWFCFVLGSLPVRAFQSKTRLASRDPTFQASKISNCKPERVFCVAAVGGIRGCGGRQGG